MAADLRAADAGLARALPAGVLLLTLDGLHRATTSGRQNINGSEAAPCMFVAARGEKSCRYS